jgi:hypothetical protein
VDLHRPFTIGLLAVYDQLCAHYNCYKSIDSMRVINESRYFVMSSCLLAGQVPFLSMHCLSSTFIYS